ncbi:D-3-phosphoglycerate dehydrogenase [Platysternon megacephalum]|uniref:D-3-phosphoglycerate dehydrogenase n=1 Tax=Platysternon megacephalum TaxID=55544 RepID=A0A4D9EIF4_9SAUR|nr:D-3-phosphoglycerate dehydrogenase [Platysternon megacephalum]
MKVHSSSIGNGTENLMPKTQFGHCSSKKHTEVIRFFSKSLLYSLNPLLCCCQLIRATEHLVIGPFSQVCRRRCVAAPLYASGALPPLCSNLTQCRECAPY